MKKTLLAAARNLLVLHIASLLSVSAAAQGVGSVVESQGVNLGQNPSSGAATPPVNSDALSLLLDQNQQLRTEIQALRGLVEEQGFEIRRLQRDSLNRYTNIDERLTALETNSVTPAPTTGGTTGSTGRTGIDATLPASSPAGGLSSRPIGGGTPINGGVLTQPPATTPATGIVSEPRTTPLSRGNGRGTLQPAVLSEQQLYQMAYDSVINSNFERSIAEFDQYLSIYPQGRFATNAYYWKGQAYLYLDRFEEARDSYAIIIEQYSDSPKLPDAMYGLGLAYQGMGNIAEARRLLNDIKRRFPNTGVANLADTRLLSLD